VISSIPKSLVAFVRVLLVLTLTARQGFPYVSTSIKTQSFTSQEIQSEVCRASALSPSLSAATFHPNGYDLAADIKVNRGARDSFDRTLERFAASVRVSWSTTILGLPKPPRDSSRPAPFRRSLRALSELVEPKKVQELIRSTQSRAEATRLLEKILSRPIGVRALDVYIKSHGVTAPWQRVNLQRVKTLVQTTRGSNEAVDLLRKELGWSTTTRNLSMYLKRHGLTAPWQRIDPKRVQTLVQTTKSRTEAVNLLWNEFGWSTTSNNLSTYLTRHSLTAPWQRTRESGAILSELVVIIAVGLSVLILTPGGIASNVLTIGLIWIGFVAVAANVGVITRLGFRSFRTYTNVTNRVTATAA
jgi:hypothetical protein